VARRLGKKTAFRACAATAAVFFGLIYLVPPHHPSLVHAVNMLGVFTAFMMSPLLWSMLGDVADFAEWRSGRRCTGLVFSATSFAMKFGLGLGGVLAGWLLTRFGYVAGAAQSVTAVRGIALMLTLIPAAGYLVLALYMGLYPLDERACASIQAALAARRDLPAGTPPR